MCLVLDVRKEVMGSGRTGCVDGSFWRIVDGVEIWSNTLEKSEVCI